MEDIPDIYELQTIEQLRAVADPLRIRIYEALALKPMTATQIGEDLGESAPKAHYHVRELERLGLVRLVETRERGGILEKYYRAVARDLRVPQSLLQQAPPDEVVKTMSDILDSIASGFKTAMSRLVARNVTDWDASMLNLSGDSLWMTPDEFQRTLKTALEHFKPYKERRGVENEHEITLNIVSYDARLGRREPDDQREPQAPPSPPTPPSPPAPPGPPSPPTPPGESATEERAGGSTGLKTRKVVVAGAVSYSRRELQEIADLGDRLDLTVIGYLAFADDVPADLVRRVIQRLSYRGVLAARDDVRVALKEKEERKN